MEVLEILVLGTVLGIAAISDYKFYRIPNKCILLGIIAGIWMHPERVLQDLAQMAVIFLIFYPFYRLKGLGAGDIKLMMMLGCFFNKNKLLEILLFSFCIGALVSIIKIVIIKDARERFIYGMNYLKKLIFTRTIDPYDNKTTNKNMVVRMAIPIYIGTFIGGVIV